MRILADIENPGLIVAKGFLMLVTGVLAGALLLLRHPGGVEAALLAVAIFGFARFYYFAFYVITHYVDGDYRYAGLGHFLAYVARARWRRARSGDGGAGEGA